MATCETLMGSAAKGLKASSDTTTAGDADAHLLKDTADRNTERVAAGLRQD